MLGIVIVDTTVLLNVLDVPGFNQNRDAVLAGLEELLDTGDNLLLPMAAIFEAGNHIAQLDDGRQRRGCAKVFRDQVRAGVVGQCALDADSIAGRPGGGDMDRRIPGRRDAAHRHRGPVHHQGMGTHVRSEPSQARPHLVT